MLITVRADFFNLTSGIKDASGKPALFERLTADNNEAILRLKAMPAEGVKEAVCEPLKLAGEGDDAANEALLEAVQSDISHQASDLPLLQVALRAAWQEHKATGRPMLECYQSVGRVVRPGEGSGQSARPPAAGGPGAARIHSSAWSGSAIPEAQPVVRPCSTNSTRRAGRCCKNSAATHMGVSSRSASEAQSSRTRR